ncbi:MAG: ABC transporter ATP-binding protein [Lachnospira sp.]
MGNILKLENISKKYGATEALKNTSLELTDGIYALVGLNGAGKTTLINLLTDNIKRTTGTITYNGTEIKKLGSKYRNIIGYMPQEQGYYKNFSGREYLAYIADLKGIRHRKEVVDSMLKQFNLQSKADDRISSYSGGMKQRLMLAQVLLNNPEILILDEPTTGLDPVERDNFKQYIKELSKDKIIIYCTHIISDITDLAERIIVIKNGVVQEKMYSDIIKNNSVDDIKLFL